MIRIGPYRTGKSVSLCTQCLVWVTRELAHSTGYIRTGGPKRLLPWSSQVIEYTVSQGESFAGPQTTGFGLPVPPLATPYCHSFLVVSSPVKDSAVVLKKVGFNEPLKPNFLIPANFSHRTLNGRNPQILAKGFSRRLNVGLRSSCSTLVPAFVRGYQIKANLQIWLQRQQITHSQQSRIDGRCAFHFKRCNDGIPAEP